MGGTLHRAIPPTRDFRVADPHQIPNGEIRGEIGCDFGFFTENSLKTIVTLNMRYAIPNGEINNAKW